MTTLATLATLAGGPVLAELPPGATNPKPNPVIVR